MMVEQHVIEPIGFISTPFKEKFGIPRQAGLAPSAKGIITLSPKLSDPSIVKDLDYFTHLWIFFIFHQNIGKEIPITVRPPRLGGNKRVGVFASRSPNRPNLIGMSVVKFQKVDLSDGVNIHVTGVDLLDQTPIVDIKPYIYKNDSISEASSGWIKRVSDRQEFEVIFSDNALSFLKEREGSNFENSYSLINEMIKNDPRPSYYWSNPKSDQKSDFAFKVYDYDVHFRYLDDQIEVYEIINAG